MTAIDPYSATQLLDAAAATGAGATYANAVSPFGGTMQNFTWAVSVTGAPSGISTTLEGSVDGTLWETLDTSTNTSGEVRGISAKPVSFLRANVGTLTGGTAPTVSVSVQPGA